MASYWGRDLRAKELVHLQTARAWRAGQRLGEGIQYADMVASAAAFGIGALAHGADDLLRYGDDVLEGMSMRRGVDIGIHQAPRHHIFPQEHRAFFAERGLLNIDDYTLPLDAPTHQEIHTWMGSGRWNDEIVGRVLSREQEAGRILSRREVMGIGAQMRREAGLQHIKVIPYKD